MKSAAMENEVHTETLHHTWYTKLNHLPCCLLVSWFKSLLPLTCLLIDFPVSTFVSSKSLFNEVSENNPL